MSTSAKTAVFSFSDGETYSVTFSPFAPADTVNFKAQCKNFNANVADTISDTFITEAGGTLNGIKSAKIVTTEDTYFYERGAN